MLRAVHNLSSVSLLMFFHIDIRKNFEHSSYEQNVRHIKNPSSLPIQRLLDLKKFLSSSSTIHSSCVNRVATLLGRLCRQNLGSTVSPHARLACVATCERQLSRHTRGSTVPLPSRVNCVATFEGLLSCPPPSKVDCVATREG